MAEPTTLPILFVGEDQLESGELTEAQIGWAKSSGFTGQRGRLLPLPDQEGKLSGYLFGTGADANRPVFVAGLAAAGLGEGCYRLAGDFGDATRAAIGFRLGGYRFDRFRQARTAPELELPAQADAEEVDRQVVAATLARDLINTPPNELGPDALDRTIRAFAVERGMGVTATVGDELVTQNFP